MTKRLLASIILISLLLLSPTIAFGKLSQQNPPDLPGSNASNSNPSLSWDPGTVDRILYQGEATTLNVSFTSTQELKNLDLWVVPELSSFVKTYPSHIDKVFSNKTTYIQLVINVPRYTQLGSYEGTLHIRQGKKTLPQTLKFELEVREPVAPPKDYAYITGYVYDSRTGAPISGAKVSAHGVDGSVYSDSTGKYTAAFTYSGTFSLTFEKERYTYAQREITVKAGLDESVEPAYLTPLDSMINTITPSGGIAKNSTATIEVRFPAGSVSENISFVITECEKSKDLPHSLPSFSHFTYASFFDVLEKPEGIVLDRPAEVKIANSLGFAPGTPIPVGTYNKNTVQWEHETMAYVTSDGMWVKYQTSRFASANDANLSSGGEGSPPQTTEQSGDNSEFACAKAQDPCIKIKSGILTIFQALPSYSSLLVPRSPVLVYNSASANPNAAIYTHTYIDPTTSPIPQTTGFTLNIQGLRKDIKFSGFSGYAKQGYIFDALNARGEKLSTGSYPYHISLSNDYQMNYYTAGYFNGPPITDTGVQTREPISLYTEVSSRLTINNQQYSPFGAGWTLSELQRLYFSPDGTIMLDEGDGGSTTYSPNGGFEQTTLSGFYFEGAAKGVKGLGPISPPEGQYMAAISTGGRAINDTTTTLTTSGALLIPQGVTKLNFKYNFVSEAYPEHIGSSYNDTFSVKLLSSLGTQSYDLASVNFSRMSPIQGIDFPGGDSTTGSTGWLTGSIDVSQYAGTGILLKIVFKVEDKGSTDYDSVVLIDDMQLSDGTTVPIYLPSTGDYSGFAKNINGTYIRHLKNGTALNFDENGFLVSTLDKNGNTMTYRYDNQWRIISISDPMGLTTIFTYTGDYIESITDPAGRITSFRISASGDLEQIINPDGSTQSFTYDSNHFLTSEIDPKGKHIDYTYTDFNRISNATFPTGDKIDFQPSEVYGVINSLPYGTGTTDNPAHPVSPSPDYITDGNGFLRQYRTNSFGSVTEFVDPLGRSTNIFRDRDNNPVYILKPDKSRTTLSYDSMGNPLAVNKYSPYSQQPDITSHYTYEPFFNSLKTIRDPNGNISTINYDSKGNPIEFIDAQGNIKTLNFYSNGLVNSMKDPLDNTTLFFYDSMGNHSLTIDPLGNEMSMVHDAAGNLISLTDSKGRNINYQNDTMNRILSMTDPVGNITTYLYDRNGNLISLIDPKGNITRFSYNELNFPSTVIDPLGSIKSFEYDSNSNLSSLTNFNGQTTHFTYNGANQLILKSSSDNITQFSYDLRDNVVSASDNDSSLALVYDYFNRLAIAKTLPTISQPFSEIAYTYDKNGNRTSVSPMGTVPANYTYDSRNLLESLESPSGVATYSYDPLSRKSSIRLPNGISTHYTYDPSSRLLSIVNKKGLSSMSSYFYTYDNVNNITDIIDSSGNNSYSYDNYNRLTRAVHPTTSTEIFAYDALGNRISSHISPFYTYDKANRLLEDAKFAYSYDSNGSLIKKFNKITGEVTKYSYDSEDQLIKVEVFPNNQSLFPSSIASYRYDALGRRIQKNINGTITKFVYDNEDIIMEFDGANSIVSSYIHGPGIDEPLSVRVGNQDYYYHTDSTGSITQITDSLANISQTYKYDSFGNILSSVGTIKQPFSYTGREYDKETGLYYHRSRYYDPNAGRFLQQDPIEPVFTTNFYRYAANNPLIFTDPFGLKDIQIHYDDTLSYVDMAGLQKSVEASIKAKVVVTTEKTTDPNYYSVFVNRRNDYFSEDVSILGLTVGNTVTISYEAIWARQTQWSLNSGNWSDMARQNLYTNVVMHELGHATGAKGIKNERARGTLMYEKATYPEYTDSYLQYSKESVNQIRARLKLDPLP